MITLRLTHGLSHDNGLVKATAARPFVTVESEKDARFCVESGFFEIVGDAPAEDSEELETMSVPELRAYAAMNGIDLGKLNRKADIIAAIREAEAE